MNLKLKLLDVAADLSNVQMQKNVYMRIDSILWHVPIGKIWMPDEYFTVKTKMFKNS